MIRAGLLAATIALAGCAAPVVTRVDAVGPLALPRNASFAVAPVPGDASVLNGEARAMVAAALRQRGWRQTGIESADYVLAVTLADRPANIALEAGSDEGRPAEILAPAANRRLSRGCAERDHRLVFTLTDRPSGTMAFYSAASEFHCKARLTDSLPHLVSAAIGRFDAGGGRAELSRKAGR